MYTLGAPRWTLFAVFLTLGCSSEPDVVAHQKQNSSGLADVNFVDGCKPGQYRGYFYGGTASGEAGSVTITGSITFVLEQQLSGEFLEVTKSTLDGQTDSGLTFTGQVNPDTPGCQAGHFTATLNGDLQLGDSTLHFEGPVEGDYGKEAFSGTWTATFVNFEVSGEWYAQWFPTVP